MNRIFTYILHKDGVIDDSAFELIAAARGVDHTVSPIAVVAGFGDQLTATCDSLRRCYSARYGRSIIRSLLNPMPKL